jgi:aryl-alcohol dehydrogenase-like predicted oxidoreductase
MNDMRRLGASGIEVSALGVGVWSWGDKGFWQYGVTHGREDIEAAYRVSLENGINFFDTAEIYGQGESERNLGDMVRLVGQPVVIASKFAPLPGRFSAQSLWQALEGSLMRLGVSKIDLYQIHWPYTLIKIEDLMEVLAEAVKVGKIRAVGVSNYSVNQMRRAQKRLERSGIPLASNQVHYSLLKRKPERDGVLQACREMNVALIAYSPLEQGLLTGRYMNEQEMPAGQRRFMPEFWKRNRIKYKPLLNVMGHIAREHDKTLAQVALNWLLCRDELVIPIPGAKNQQQARQNAGGMGWRMSEDEFARIDRAANQWLK